MPPSQLKALKSQLREKGITAPSKSKKDKKNGPSTSGKDRATALAKIRTEMNPYEYRHISSRPAKFPSTSVKGSYKDVLLRRPGVSKSAGEEVRRKQLLPEMRGRLKSGGLVDRRIGEGDGGMDEESRAVARFAREKSRNVFDLEGSEDEGGGGLLTHGGRAIADLEEDDMKISGDEEGSEDDGFLVRKRQREDEEDEVVDEQPDVKKSKKEVMTELIAKSKLHKYERQKTKEDDDDLRDKLDAGMADLLPLLRAQTAHPPPPPKPVEVPGDVSKINPERQKLLDGMDRGAADREYEKRLRELARDTRAAPSDRTKTAEEKAKDAAEKVKELAIRREKRMRGEAVSDDEEVEQAKDERDDSEEEAVVDEYGNEVLGDDAEEFGLASAAMAKIEKVQHVDEDDFDFAADLVASASEADEESASSDDASDDAALPNDVEEEEDEFVSGILGRGANAVPIADPNTKTVTLLSTHDCPRTHADLLALIKDSSAEGLPTLIQRLRAQYQPSLAAENKGKMEDFSRVLVEHLVWMAEQGQEMKAMEQVIRHLHSLSRTYAIPIAEAFRSQLGAWLERSSGEGDGMGVSKGDLIVLVAIGEIYPTSDHFHQVVTPTFTLVGRWLGLNAGVKGMGKERSRVGALMVGLCVKWVGESKRFVPEAVRFTLAALGNAGGVVGEHLENLKGMAELWKEKSAFFEAFEPFIPVLRKLAKPAKPTLLHLTTLLDASRKARKPLMLHHHRPQPLRTSNPKFEEGFNPDRHYDPDKERSEAAKLKKEFKREKKGAVRELRKDASFVAREQLRSKRVEDEEHKKRERRLIAEIQSESRG
ncbi:nucleolar complex protein 14 [Elasticomyces elasticus]|nr:nucleolar complex protein 14 [Elasticomyces elasticus]KAK4970866.1 nucleolar complex protein 14 [Elasticomyces elasticus]